MRWLDSLDEYELQLRAPLWLCAPLVVLCLLFTVTTVLHLLEKPSVAFTQPSPGQCNCALIAAHPDGAFGGPVPLKENR